MISCARCAAIRSIRPVAASCRRNSFPLWPTPPYPRARHLATPPPMLTPSDLSMSKYHTISDKTMDSLLESLEALVDALNDARYEVEYSSGVLTLVLGDKGTYVINKQPPNKQIWLSSPFSGPKRYEYSEAKDVWFYSRDGKTLGTLLKDELESVLGRDIELGMT